MGFCKKPNGLIFLNAVNFRRGLTCALWLPNALTEAVANRGLKPVYVKVKPNHVLKTVSSPRLAAVYQVIG